jgi:hypothetical protein
LLAPPDLPNAQSVTCKCHYRKSGSCFTVERRVTVEKTGRHEKCQNIDRCVKVGKAEQQKVSRGMPRFRIAASHHTSDFFRGRDAVDLTPPGSFLNVNRRTWSRMHIWNRLRSKYRARARRGAIENNRKFIHGQPACHANRCLSPPHEHSLDLLANLFLLALLQLLQSRIKSNQIKSCIQAQSISKA